MYCSEDPSTVSGLVGHCDDCGWRSVDVAKHVEPPYPLFTSLPDSTPGLPLAPDDNYAQAVHDSQPRHYVCERAAIRVVNLARLLPNPQPPGEIICGKCSARVGEKHKEGCPVWNVLLESMHTKTVIAPTHALRIYIDALKLAKGEGWYEWLEDNTFYSDDKRFNNGHKTVWTPCSDMDYRNGQGNMLCANGCTVFDNGAIECGPVCPPLPVVV